MTNKDICQLYNKGICRITNTQCYDCTNNLCSNIRKAYNIGFMDYHNLIHKNKNESEKEDHDINGMG